MKNWLIRKLGGVPAEHDGNLINHAIREMEFAWPEYDDMQEMMKRDLLDIVAVFSAQGHSGMSAPYAIKCLRKLLAFEPIAPLTGEEWEWQELDGFHKQNIRCSHVFMDSDGNAYDIEGKVFVEPDGMAYTSGESKVPVEFPYTPETEFVQIGEQDE